MIRPSIEPVAVSPTAKFRHKIKMDECIHPYTRQLVTKQPLFAPPSCTYSSTTTSNFRASKRNGDGREEVGKPYRNIRCRIVTFNLYDNLITDKSTPSNPYTLRRKKIYSFSVMIVSLLIQSLQNMFYFFLHRRTQSFSLSH